MPRPTASTTLQRPDLGAIAYEYMLAASQRGFIGLQLLPIFGVSEQSADFPVIPIEALIKLPATARRTARGKYQRGDYEFETDTYSCIEHGWEEPVDETEAKLYRRFFNAEEIAVMRATDIILRLQEKRIADMLFNTSNITNTAAVTTEWSTAATCTPKADVKAAKQAMRAASGLEPDAIAMSKKVFENVLISDEIKDYMQYTNPHFLSTEEQQRQMLAKYLGVEDILIGNAIYDAAKKNKAFTITDIWDDEYVLLYKKAMNSQDLREPALGRTFLWEADTPNNIITESYREEQTRSDIYRVRQYTDEEIVFAGAGYLLSNITA